MPKKSLYGSSRSWAGPPTSLPGPANPPLALTYGRARSAGSWLPTPRLSLRWVKAIKLYFTGIII